MGETGERTFKVEGLSQSDWNRVEDSRRMAERVLGPLTNKEFLMTLVNDTSPSWRKGR